jgi:hypothetical protein
MKLLLDLVSKSSSSFSPRRFEPSQLTQNVDSCSLRPSSVLMRRSTQPYELTKRRTACLSRMKPFDSSLSHRLLSLSFNNRSFSLLAPLGSKQATLDTSSASLRSPAAFPVTSPAFLVLLQPPPTRPLMSGMIRSLRPYGEFPVLRNGGSSSERKDQRNKGKGKAVERDEGEEGGQGAYISFS